MIPRPTRTDPAEVKRGTREALDSGAAEKLADWIGHVDGAFSWP